MKPKDKRAVPRLPSNSKRSTRRDNIAPWGIELRPRRAIGGCDNGDTHVTTQLRGEEHSRHTRACDCHNCAFFSDERDALPAVGAWKRVQGAKLKRHPARGLTKTVVPYRKAAVHVRKLTIKGEDLAGKESTWPQPEARPPASPQEEISQGPLPPIWPPPPSSLLYAPETLGQQLAVLSLSGEPHGPSALPNVCSSLILQPCATPGPLLLQPQAPSAPCQAGVSASLEWQRKLEAAEALLALQFLQNFSPVPPASISLQQPHIPPGTLPLEGGTQGPAGEKGPQPPSPCVASGPSSSVSLPFGQLGCSSLLS